MWALDSRRDDESAASTRTNLPTGDLLRGAARNRATGADMKGFSGTEERLRGANT